MIVACHHRKDFTGADTFLLTNMSIVQEILYRIGKYTICSEKLSLANDLSFNEGLASLLRIK